MFGVHCDKCGRFAKEEDCEGWGRIQTLKAEYDGNLVPTGITRHVCPVCLDMITEGFLN